jgi:prevent-host-death family protein
VAPEVATSPDREIEPPHPDAPAVDDAGTREIGVKELKNNTSEVIDRVVNGERVIVTRRNELAALILSIDEALDFVLAHAEDFVRARQRARAGCRSE